VIELAEGLHALGSGKGGHVRAFLIENGTELTLVDTLFEDDAHLVLEAIGSLGRSPTDLKRIAITHAHRSHLGGLAALKRASGAAVYAHPWEADIIGGQRRAQPVTLRPKGPLKLMPFRIGLRFNRPKHKPYPPDEPLEPGDAFGPLHVLDAAGHSPGHLAFHWPERDFLIAGDAIATWPSFGPGWPAFHLNEAQHAESLRRLAALDARILGVGHGDPIPDGAADRVHSLVS